LQALGLTISWKRDNLLYNRIFHVFKKENTMPKEIDLSNRIADLEAELETAEKIHEKAHMVMVEKLEAKDDKIEQVRDQKRFWQFATVFLIIILVFFGLIGSFKSQDYVDRLILDADVSARANDSLRLMCKVLQAKNLTDPICVALGEQVEAGAIPAQQQVTWPPSKSAELKFMVKGPTAPTESAAVVGNSASEKTGAEEEPAEQAAPEETAAEDTAAEESPANEESGDEAPLDLDSLNKR